MGLFETFSSHNTNLKISLILSFLIILQKRHIIPDFTTGHFFLDELVLNLNFFAKSTDQRHSDQSAGHNILFDYVLAVPWRSRLVYSLFFIETKAHSLTQSDQFSQMGSRLVSDAIRQRILMTQVKIMFIRMLRLKSQCLCDRFDKQRKVYKLLMQNEG